MSKSHKEVLLKFMLAVTPVIMASCEEEGKVWDRPKPNDDYHAFSDIDMYTERIFAMAVDLTAKYFDLNDHELDLGLKFQRGEYD